MAEEVEPRAHTETDSSINGWEKFGFGIVLPLLAMSVMLFAVMAMDSASGAAEFAALGIFLITLTIAPFLIIIMVVVAIRPATSRIACFKRGMVAPSIVVLGAFLFQLGLF